MIKDTEISEYLEKFTLNTDYDNPGKKPGYIPYSSLDSYLEVKGDAFGNKVGKNTHGKYEFNATVVEEIEICGINILRYINEFWTSKQRQASSIHEISYRACFKPQVPRFFIELLTDKGDIVYDPFGGRGTTVIEAGILGRNIIHNDVNPLSTILTKPRFFIPEVSDVEERLKNIHVDYGARADLDLSMFYHPKTEAELVSLRNYLSERKQCGEEDPIDSWIRMVATNRLTGHSKGFFSVYTLPPNQAVSPERQIKINRKRNQTPEYRNIFPRIIAKTKSLLRNLSRVQKENLLNAGMKGQFLEEDAAHTERIRDNSVQLIVTSPPFLNVVQYSKDNWLRCWFNEIDVEEVSKKIIVTGSVNVWTDYMQKVFDEFYRVVKSGGWVAFEVGEVRKGSIKLDEYIVPLGIKAGFKPIGIIVNYQKFTKTSNIWGIKNNKIGTNTNRIVLFHKRV